MEIVYFHKRMKFLNGEINRLKTVHKHLTSVDSYTTCEGKLIADVVISTLIQL
jgi:hypothetical protein